MKKLILSLMVLSSFSASAKLLDKTVAVINNKIITQSQIKRVQQTFVARKSISPLYGTTDNNQESIINTLWMSFIIRDKLSNLGYVITDDSVESRINQIQQRQGMSREILVSQLESQGLSFNEFFELTREAIEFTHFNSRIIVPLISITDQEIKNAYFKLNSDKKTLSFKYKLIDYQINKALVTDERVLAEEVQNYHLSGIISSKFKDVDKIDLGEIQEDGLSKQIKSMLKGTDEGKFAKPLLIGDTYHLFYVKGKDLTESSDFLKSKKAIHARLFDQKAKNVAQSWFKRELSNYYTKKM